MVKFTVVMKRSTIALTLKKPQFWLKILKVVKLIKYLNISFKLIKNVFENFLLLTRSI